MSKEKLALRIVRARHALMALILLCAALSALCIGRTHINYDLTRYLSDGTMTKRALRLMEEEFGTSEQLRVMFSDQTDEALAGYVDAINALPDVLLAAHEPDAGVRTAEGKTYQLVTVTLNGEDGAGAVRQLRGMFPEAGEYAVGGSAADLLDAQRSVADEIPVVMLISVAVVLAMLLVTSHAWLEPVILLAVLSVSIVINMGTNFIFPDVSFITFAVSAILQLALSIDYAIMLLHTFNGYRDAGRDAEAAMTAALAECFMRISSSAFTTIAGLLSLLFMSFTIGFDIGLVLSKGIVCSMLCVFLLMPAVILMLEKPLRRTRHTPLRLPGGSLARGVARCKRPLAGVMILAVLCGLYLNSRNEYAFTHAQERSDSESARIVRRFGADNPLVFLVPGGDTDADFARQRALADSLLAIRMENGGPAIESVTSMVTTGEAALQYYTPREVAALTGQSETAVSLFFLVNGFGASVRADRLLDAASALAAGNEEIAALQARLAAARSAFMGKTKARLLAEADFSASDPGMMSAMDRILAAAAEVYGEEAYVTGTAMSTYDIANAFRGDLLKVNLITLLAILLIVTASFRSFGLPLLLVFVIEGAIWITMGISCLMGEPIFFISYLICLSIQMGATIDYGILLCDQYRTLRRRGESPDRALAGAMEKALPTILTSGIILIVAGFIVGKMCSIYYISSIGLLISRGALVSALLVLTLLPALLLLCDKRIIRQGKNE